MIARLLIALSLLLAAPALAQDAGPDRHRDPVARPGRRRVPGDRRGLQRQPQPHRTAGPSGSRHHREAGDQRRRSPRSPRSSALIDARIGQLGPVTPGVVEAPDIRAQRKLLAQQRSTVDFGDQARQAAGRRGGPARSRDRRKPGQCLQRDACRSAWRRHSRRPSGLRSCTRLRETDDGSQGS